MNYSPIPAFCCGTTQSSLLNPISDSEFLQPTTLKRTIFFIMSKCASSLFFNNVFHSFAHYNIAA